MFLLDIEKKNAKASTRSAALVTKKNALISGARKEAETMMREGRAYMYDFSLILIIVDPMMPFFMHSVSFPGYVLRIKYYVGAYTQ